MKKLKTPKKIYSIIFSLKIIFLYTVFLKRKLRYELLDIGYYYY